MSLEHKGMGIRLISDKNIGVRTRNKKIPGSLLFDRENGELIKNLEVIYVLAKNKLLYESDSKTTSSTN